MKAGVGHPSDPGGASYAGERERGRRGSGDESIGVADTATDRVRPVNHVIAAFAMRGLNVVTKDVFAGLRLAGAAQRHTPGVLPSSRMLPR